MATKMRLTNINIVNLLHEPGYEEIQAHFSKRRVVKNEMICAPGDGVNHVFIVRSGRVRVFLSYDEKEFTLAFLEPGDIFSTHTRAFVQATEGSSILITSVKQFQKDVARHPEFALIMVKVLGEVLQNSFDIVEGLVFMDSRMRLIEFLITAAEERGSAEGDGVTLELGLSVEDLSRLVGTARQTVSVVLNKLTRDGYIDRVRKGVYHIADFTRFKELGRKFEV